MTKKPAMSQANTRELIHEIHEYGLNCDTREIFVHGFDVAGEESGVDYRMAERFIKNLTILTHLSHTKPILIHMITCGGNWNYGMAMYDAIAACPSPTITLSYGHAESMSSMIIQAANYRVLQPHTDFLIHHGSCKVDDNCIAVESYVKYMVQSQAQYMLDIYAKRAINGKFFQEKGWDVGQIKKFFDKRMRYKQDWYMSPRQAMNYGLLDAVLGDIGYENMDALRKKT